MQINEQIRNMNMLIFMSSSQNSFCLQNKNLWFGSQQNITKYIQNLLINSMSDTYVQLGDEGNQSQRARQLSQQQIQQQAMNNAGSMIGMMICGITLFIFIFALSFIIPSLIFAYQGSECVTTYVQGFSFTLATWLKVDAFVKIGIICLLFISAIATCISLQFGAVALLFVIGVIITYSLFSLAWTIVGSVLFWGMLDPLGICTGGVQAYMYAFLIISYVGIFCNCCFSKKSGGDYF